MDSVTRHIIKSQQLASFRFDSALMLSAQNQRALILIKKLAPLPPNQNHLIDLFPELIGYEEKVSAIFSDRKSHFTISDVNRDLSQGKMSYFDLTVVAAGDGHNGFLLVKDVTAAASARRELNQMRYEKMLAHHGISGVATDPRQAILGESPAIQKVRQTVKQLTAVPQATVLILGESGTGKDLTANLLHYSCRERSCPFVEINCAAIPENLLEAELFGYEKGAFTGAIASREGLFKAAEGGTIFLNEIGEMPLSLQAKLLTVLETKTFRKLGSNKTTKVNARVIAATNQDLELAVQEKRFRKDLFYRLNVVTITMPPLREMGRDRLIIADHLLTHYNRELQKRVATISSDAQKKIMDYHWPGNVRELANCIERAMIFCRRPQIEADDLMIQMSAMPREPLTNRWEVPTEGLDLEMVERQLIESALKKAGGNKSRAAELLGMSRDTLRYRMTKYKL